MNLIENEIIYLRAAAAAARSSGARADRSSGTAAPVSRDGDGPSLGAGPVSPAPGVKFLKRRKYPYRALINIGSGATRFLAKSLNLFSQVCRSSSWVINIFLAERRGAVTFLNIATG